MSEQEEDLDLEEQLSVPDSSRLWVARFEVGRTSSGKWIGQEGSFDS